MSFFWKKNAKVASTKVRLVSLSFWTFWRVSTRIQRLLDIVYWILGFEKACDKISYEGF